MYLDSLCHNPATAEPFVAALGGAPLALISHIENDLRTLERNRIKPVFVLSGITPVRKTRPFEREDAGGRLRAAAWEAYEEGNVEKMQDLLTQSASTDINDVVRSVLRAFRHRNVEFLVAPYLATAQLVSLERHPRGFAHSIYGSTTLFLFPRVDRVVLSFDLAGGTFVYASKQAILQELNLRTDDEFLDLGVLAGWDHGSTFPPLLDGTVVGGTTPANSISLRAVADLVRQYRSAVAVCHAFADHPQVKQRQFLEHLCRSKAIIKYSLVVRAEDGAVMPMSLATSPSVASVGGVNGTSSNGSITSTSDITSIPSDLHDVFSQRLPDELFLHLSRGLISPHVHNWLTSGYLAVPPPLDNGDTQEYRRFLREWLVESAQSPCCVALALAASALHPSFASRRVSAVYWHSPGPSHEKPVLFDAKSTQSLVARVNAWNVPVAFVEEELRRQNSSTIDIALCLGATGSNDLAARTKTPRAAKAAAKGATAIGAAAAADGPSTTTTATTAVANPTSTPSHSSPLDKKDEIVANTLWRMLELRGFLNHDHLHTPYARALHLAVRSSRLNDKLQEPLYLALELIRAGALHANRFTSADDPHSVREYSGGPAVEQSDADKRSLLLVMRCMSLVPMQYKPDAWTAPVSRELLVFNSFVRSLGRSMRHLVEMIASSMLLRGDARRNRDDYLDIGLSLPFQSDANTGLGVVIKCYAEAFIAFCGAAPTAETRDTPDIVSSREEVLVMLEETFGNVRSVRGELQRAFRFWDRLMVAVRQLAEKDSVSKEVVGDFEQAEVWLAGFAF